MYEDNIHNWIGIDSIKDCTFCRAEFSEELRDKCFCLSVIEDGLIIFLIEVKFEVRVIDQLLNFLNKFFRFGAVDLEAYFQVLIVEDSDVSLWIFKKYFDNSVRVN